MLELKIVATSTYSKSSQNVIEDAFFLKMRQSACVDNRLSFDPSSTYPNIYGLSVAADVIYEIGTTAALISPKYSTLIPTTSCPLFA